MSSEQNVLILIGNFDTGGAESQAIQLARLLRDEGRYRVHLACVRRTGVLLKDAERLGLGEIGEFPITSLRNSSMAAQLPRFVRFLKERHIALAHSQDFYMNVFGMTGAALARVPARIGFWGWIGDELPGSHIFLQRQSLRLVHVVHANSERVKLKLRRMGVPERKIVTVYNGLDLDRVTPQPGFRREDFLAELGLPRDGRFVALVANMRLEIKNHRMFLQAARLVQEAVPGACFVLAGEGDLTASLRALAVELGIEKQTFFVGRCDRVAELLASSDVGVLSSTTEGFSNSILEYMGAALPVVATNVGGASEAIAEGESGYLVNSGDHEAMAARIITLLRDPALARAMGDRGREVVEKKFSSRAQLENTRGLYDRLLARRGSNQMETSPSVQV